MGLFDKIKDLFMDEVIDDEEMELEEENKKIYEEPKDVLPKVMRDNISREEKGINFDELKSLKKFYVTDINSRWVKSRFESWIDEKGNENSQFTSDKDAEEFLNGFYSENTGTFWTESYANRIFECLPDNSAKQIVVWNPGCGKGYETYSLACILKRRYPDARIKIYAHEVDLLSISNAPLLIQQGSPHILPLHLFPFH